MYKKLYGLQKELNSNRVHNISYIFLFTDTRAKAREALRFHGKAEGCLGECP